MTPVSPNLFCPVCNEVIGAADAQSDGAGGAPHCPFCAGLLRPNGAGLGNPMNLSIIATFAGPLARLLKRTGVLAYLDGRAKASPNKVDDFLIRIAITVLHHMAEL